jgi:hypothetical protein
MILFLVFVLIAFHPVGFALLLLALAAFLCFALLPPFAACIITAVVGVALSGARQKSYGRGGNGARTTN